MATAKTWTGRNIESGRDRERKNNTRSLNFIGGAGQLKVGRDHEKRGFVPGRAGNRRGSSDESRAGKGFGGPKRERDCPSKHDASWEGQLPNWGGEEMIIKREIVVSIETGSIIG